jgi:hypothetical protein
MGEDRGQPPSPQASSYAKASEDRSVFAKASIFAEASTRQVAATPAFVDESTSAWQESARHGGRRTPVEQSG